MAFTIASVDVEKVSEEGGQEIVVTGVFESGGEYEVYIGPLGNDSDPVCHSGKAGQGASVYPVELITLRCYTPLLEPGTTVDVTVTNIGTAETHTLAAELDVTYRQFESTVFALRKVFPHFYKMGARDIDIVPPV